MFFCVVRWAFVFNYFLQIFMKEIEFWEFYIFFIFVEGLFRVSCSFTENNLQTKKIWQKMSGNIKISPPGASVYVLTFAPLTML